MQRIGLVGTGNLGSALALGWLRAQKHDLTVYDKDDSKTQQLEQSGKGRVRVVRSLEEVPAEADLVFVAVKPGDIPAVLRELAHSLRSEHIVVSTAAGVTLARLREALGAGPRLYRVMPNLAVSLGAGITAVAAEEQASSQVTAAVLEVFEGLGRVDVVAESLLNVITALSASSPAFLALALEGLEDGAVRAGMPRALARPIVVQAALGAAQLLLEEGIPPAVLKERVSSPGGTTIAGLAVLEDRAVSGAFLRAIEAAAERGRELGG